MATTSSSGQVEGQRATHALFTIGFTQKSAREFFGRLREAGVQRVIDVRLNNVSQLAGFTKRADLEFFLGAIGAIGYVHHPELAPTQEMLDDYRKRHKDWARYERDFTELLAARRVEERFSSSDFAGGCLLCSEPTAEHCHRRLVAEYLGARWGDLAVTHL